MVLCYGERLLVVETKYNSMTGCWCSTEVVGSFGVRVRKYMRGWGVFSKFVDMKWEMR
jgi:hypothetical protein